MSQSETWKVVGGAMQEDGLHGVDGYEVWKGDERADDSFFQDRDDAQEMADRLNEEDRYALKDESGFGHFDMHGEYDHD